MSAIIGIESNNNSMKPENIEIKLDSVQIKNYKSINECSFDFSKDNITVLAGMNESGKTNIFDALVDFRNPAFGLNSAEKIKIPMDLPKEIPEIIITYEIKENQNNTFYVSLIKKYGRKDPYYTYYTTIPPRIYGRLIELDYDLRNFLKSVEVKIGPTNDLLNAYINKENSKMSAGSIVPIETFKRDARNYNNLRETCEDVILYLNVLDMMLNKKEKEKLRKLLKRLSALPEKCDDINIKKYGPVIWPLLSSFVIVNINWNKTSFMSDNKNDVLAKLISKVSNKDLEFLDDISGENIPNVQENLLVTAKILTDRYRELTNDTTIEFRLTLKQESPDNRTPNKIPYSITVGIKDNVGVNGLHRRSQGKKQFISIFFDLLNKKNLENPVIILDEPGNNLHATAQKNLLKTLQQISKDIPIIYSTHSPYLLDTDHLDRIKCVSKTKNGTKVDKINKTADKDILKHLITAIGDDISKDLFNSHREHNFIVEGISDYYYLNAFNKMFDNLNISFMPGCGDNLHHTAGILIGWGLNPSYILDTDSTTIHDNLQKYYGVTIEEIINILEGKCGAIEDIFSNNDFENLILSKENGYSEIDLGDYTSISECIRKKNIQKELISKNFYNRVKNGEITPRDFDETTSANINRLFEKINEKIELKNSEK